VDYFTGLGQEPLRPNGQNSSSTLSGSKLRPKQLVPCPHNYGFKYAASFEYGDGPHGAERDFVVFSSGFLENGVDVIFGECKTAEAFGGYEEMPQVKELPDLPDKEKNDVRVLGRRTDSYLAFCTLAATFSDADKQYFREPNKHADCLRTTSFCPGSPQSTHSEWNSPEKTKSG
jgi:hypothetical protein